MVVLLTIYLHRDTLTMVNASFAVCAGSGWFGLRILVRVQNISSLNFDILTMVILITIYISLIDCTVFDCS